MPNWRIHLEIAKRVNQERQYTGNDLDFFMLGNILPDINNAYTIEDVSKKISHRYTHFKHEEKEMHLEFLNQYGNEVFNNPLLYGYFTHLYTDYLWNTNFKRKAQKIEELKDLSKVELRIIKQREFRSYNNNFMNNHLHVKKTKRAAKECKKINRVFIKEKDIKKIIDVLRIPRVSSKKLKYYTKEELDSLLNETVESILEFK